MNLTLSIIKLYRQWSIVYFCCTQTFWQLSHDHLLVTSRLAVYSDAYLYIWLYVYVCVCVCVCVCLKFSIDFWTIFFLFFFFFGFSNDVTLVYEARFASFSFRLTMHQEPFGCYNLTWNIFGSNNKKTTKNFWCFFWIRQNERCLKRRLNWSEKVV